MLADPAATDYARWVHRLGDPLRGAAAQRHLLGAGVVARAAVLAGLGSRDAQVRRRCARLLDQLGDADALASLVPLLADPEHDVRIEAIHARACDRCKDGHCALPIGVLERAIAILQHDPEPHVRAYAVELVGRFVHEDAAASAALVASSADDPSAAVRKKASWYAPGGAVHQRTAPRRR